MSMKECWGGGGKVEVPKTVRFNILFGSVVCLYTIYWGRKSFCSIWTLLNILCSFVKDLQSLHCSNFISKASHFLTTLKSSMSLVVFLGILISFRSRQYRISIFLRFIHLLNLVVFSFRFRLLLTIQFCTFFFPFSLSPCEYVYVET